MDTNINESCLGPVVLVVEDEPLVRMFAADVLMEAGFKVFEACNADEAIQMLQARNDIGAVFTDIEMAGTMDGLALATAIAERWPTVPVLVTSGRIKPDGMLPVGTSFIGKPYPADGLLALLCLMTQVQASQPVEASVGAEPQS